MKIAVITCYRDPDYVRARTLRAALKITPGVRVVVVKNTHKGVLRYPQIMWKLWQVKRRQRPDVYLLTFRGQEILPFVLLLAGKKPVLFDELIVPIAYANQEHHASSLSKRVYYFLARRSEFLYRGWVQRCYAVLADTSAHAELSAKTNHVNLSKYLVLPVGTDEKVFALLARNMSPTQPFQVFYYSTGMQPLHGLEYVLAAADQLQHNENITFLIVGGKKPLQQAVKAATRRGARVRYEAWVAFEELPGIMQASGICLGGPFGDTPQAHHVVTTKTYQMLAVGAPVIVGASEATSEYFEDKQNALVVPQGDAAALARAIVWAHKHPVELKSIGDKGRKLYEKEFSTAAIAAKLRPLIETLTS